MMVRTIRRKVSASYHYSGLIDRQRFGKVAAQCSKVVHCARAPEKGMPELIARKRGRADRLASFVQNRTRPEIRDIAWVGQSSTETAKILHPAVLPEEWVDCWHTGRIVWNGICVGQTVDQSRFIDHRGERIVTAECPEVLKAISLPEERPCLGRCWQESIREEREVGIFPDIIERHTNCVAALIARHRLRGVSAKGAKVGRIGAVSTPDNSSRFWEIR